jgi:hypothetical protein
VMELVSAQWPFSAAVTTSARRISRWKIFMVWILSNNGKFSFRKRHWRILYKLFCHAMRRLRSSRRAPRCIRLGREAAHSGFERECKANDFAHTKDWQPRGRQFRAWKFSRRGRCAIRWVGQNFFHSAPDHFRAKRGLRMFKPFQHKRRAKICLRENLPALARLELAVR